MKLVVLLVVSALTVFAADSGGDPGKPNTKEFKKLKGMINKSSSAIKSKLDDMSSNMNNINFNSTLRLQRMDKSISEMNSKLGDMKLHVRNMNSNMHNMNSSLISMLQSINAKLESIIDCKDTVSTSRNCLDLMKQGKLSGIYKIFPCDDNPSKAVDVYCDMDTDGGGWTVIQRRDNFPQQENFLRTWQEYLKGFGDVSKDFWLGNENIHCLTDQTNNEIRFDLVDWTDEARYAKYGHFYVDDEDNKFKIDINTYTGTAGDSMVHHNGKYFTTIDADNDSHGNSVNCAEKYKGAWWYFACHWTNLNGVYNNTDHASGITWYQWKGHGYSLKKTEMKLRPTN